MAQAVQRLVGTVPRLIKATQDVAVPKFQTFWKFARVELRPPNPSEWSEIQKGFGNLVTAARTNKWRNLTVKEATLNTLVAVEVACWFFVGEVIGKGTLVGYQIPGAVDFEVHI